MTKPLAIDLFCGLTQPKFFLGAYAAIKEFVAGGAQYPYHMSLSICDDLPCTVSLEFRLMRHFKNPALTTAFTSERQIGIFASKAPKHAVLERAAGVVDFLNSRLSSHEQATVLSRGVSRTTVRTISSVSIRWNDLKMVATSNAVPAVFRDVILFASASSSRSALTAWRAIFFVGAGGHKFCGTINANQFVHVRYLS